MLTYTNLRIANVNFWGPGGGTNGGIHVSWATDDIGFGNIYIFKDYDGSLIHVVSEGMPKAFVEHVLRLLAGNLDEDVDSSPTPEVPRQILPEEAYRDVIEMERSPGS